MLTETQLDWLAEQAGWKLDNLGTWWKGDSEAASFSHPSISCDRLIADHDGWMTKHSIWYLVRRSRGGDGQLHWTAEMWGGHLDAEAWFDADTPEAALAEAFYHARGGPQ